MTDREEKPDWVVIAKSAGDNGIRYRTNNALIKFIGEIREEFACNHSTAQLSAALQAPEVAALVERAFKDGAALANTTLLRSKSDTHQMWLQSKVCAEIAALKGPQT